MCERMVSSARGSGTVSARVGPTGDDERGGRVEKVMHNSRARTSAAASILMQMRKRGKLIT